MDKIEKMTNEQLKDEYRGYYQQIYQVECYGTSDLRRLDSVANELDRRGITIDNQPHFTDPIEEEDDEESEDDKVTHDFVCKECGKPATREFSMEFVEFPISPSGEFGDKVVLDGVDDSSEFYCDDHDC